MIAKRFLWWFSVISVILVLWGVVFTVFGLGVLPVINHAVLLRWESALYGAIMIGWGTTLFSSGASYSDEATGSWRDRCCSASLHGS